MSATELIIVMLIAIGSAIAAVLVTVWVSSLVQAHRVRIEPTLGEARFAIVAALSGDPQQSADALANLSRFSQRYIVSVLLDLAPSVSGTSRSVLVSLGEQTGVIDAARTGVDSRRWSKRLYSPASSRPSVSSQRPCTPSSVTGRPRCGHRRPRGVRPSPTRWASNTWSGGWVDADGQCRFAAQDALIRIGLPATGALIAALATADNDVAARILEIAAAIGDDRYCSWAHTMLANPLNANRALAATVLASTGNRTAGPTLVALLDDRSDDVVLAATAGLGRLTFWSGAAAVEPLLSHPSWEIRKQAGMTLLALGAPGTILLRSDAPGVGPAADMATHSLQLQSLSTQKETV